jgi:hypothetical protein
LSSLSYKENSTYCLTGGPKFGDGKEVSSASNQTGQPHIPLHSIPGIMNIPLFTYDFQKTGEYKIKVPEFGILFSP